VNHWVGGAVGVVSDEHGGVPKWDELLKCKCDIDATGFVMANNSCTAFSP